MFKACPERSEGSFLGLYEIFLKLRMREPHFEPNPGCGSGTQRLKSKKVGDKDERLFGRH
jgi:hypothetical protein